MTITLWHEVSPSHWRKVCSAQDEAEGHELGSQISGSNWLTHCDYQPGIHGEVPWTGEEVVHVPKGPPPLLEPPRVSTLPPSWKDEPLLIFCAAGARGLGDCIQVLRCVVLPHTNCKKVIATHKQLVSLFRSFPGTDAAVVWTEDFSAFDFCFYNPAHDFCFYHPAGPIQLTHERATLEALVQSRPYPYLFADPGRVAHWQQRLGGRRGFRVGLQWEGSVSKIPLKYFEPLSKVPGVELYGLALLLTGLRQLDDIRFPVIDLGSSFDWDDMSDCAAALTCLDLVITTDNSIAHLAGALGIPVWLLLPFQFDPRWHSDGEDTPLYPSMRIFRQQPVDNAAEESLRWCHDDSPHEDDRWRNVRRRGNWPEVMQRVQAALSEEVSRYHATCIPPCGPAAGHCSCAG